MIDMRPATLYDIRHVVFRMWRRGAAEIAKHGDFDKENIIKILGERSHEYGYAFFHQQEPVAVFGAHAVSDKQYHTWFTATDKFEKIGRHATKYLKEMVAAKTQERPDVRLELWTVVDHPDADRWFKLLGFTPLPDEGIFHRYLYHGRKRLTKGAESRIMI